MNNGDGFSEVVKSVMYLIVDRYGVEDNFLWELVVSVARHSQAVYRSFLFTQKAE